MVIVCPECSTKFRVNPERIPASGAKLRCARCKHIFLATKPVPAEEPVPEVEAPQTPEDESFSAGSKGTSFQLTEEPVEEPVSAPETEPEAEPEAELPENEGTGFSYDQFRELDSQPGTDDDFTFGDEEEPKEALPQETEQGETFSFSGPEEKTPAQADEEPATPAPAKEEPAGTEEKSSDSPETKEPAEDEEPELPPAEAKGSPSTSIIRILLLLILGLVIIGAALYFINGPERIEQAIDQIFGQHTRSPVSGQIALANLEGKFINNQEAGELFIIRGEATNKYNEARAAIQVKGVIFDQNGKPLLQKTIFCGNPINDQELQTLPFSKLEEMMRNQFGKSLTNMKVNSKETIPFVIAFKDLPQNLSEFSVDVTSSEPAVK